MLDWLPAHTDFQGALRAAVAAPEPRQRLSALRALSHYRLGYLETIQLDRALSQATAESPGELSPLRLALLASSTADHLKPSIRIAGLRRGVLVEIYLGTYGQYRQELLDSSSRLHRFKPQFVLFSLTAREFLSEVTVDASSAEIEGLVARYCGELSGLWQRAREGLGAGVIQQTFFDFTEPLFGSFDRQVAGAPARAVALLNDNLASAAAAEGVLLLDLARASAREGRDTWFDPTRWLQAKMEVAPGAAPLYGELVARILAAVRGLSRKCLVMDLDNTLWGGVIGDDGVEGIVLGEGSAAGEAHLAVQRYAKLLGQRGIILAVCSKNHQATAEAAFRDHPEMILKLSDIACFVANWEDKAANLPRIAEQLNIGLDSLVFLDDNPVERARIRESLPMVAVPELPADPGRYVRCLAEAGYFEAVAFTSDDRQRGAQYAANAAREALRTSSDSLDGFLSGLDMSVTSGPFTAVDLPRVVQLINKTNQFNPTTRRYTADEVERLLGQGDCLTIQFRLVDRFGDNGLVSAMILTPNPDEDGALEIDTWVMSCRVFGRELERESMNQVAELARARGVRVLRAAYLPTAKNSVVAELYPGLGFQPLAAAPANGGGSRWRLTLADYIPRPTHIARKTEDR